MSRPVLDVLRSANEVIGEEWGYDSDLMEAIATVERMAEALGGFLAEFGDKTDNSANVRNARAALRAYRGEQA